MPTPPKDSWPPSKKLHFKRREFERVNESAGRKPYVATNDDVRAMLDVNVRHDQYRGRYKLAPRRQRPSGRRRDCFGAWLLGNLGLVVVWYFLPRNAFTLLFAIGGSVIFTVGLLWMMFVVADDE